MRSQFVEHERRHEAVAIGRNIARDCRAEAFPLAEGLRNIGLRRPTALRYDPQNIKTRQLHRAASP
jgi:hypothetical protein